MSFARRGYSREELARLLFSYAAVLDRTPAAADVRRPDRGGVPSLNTFIRHFGSWCAAQREAGLSAIDRCERQRRTHCDRGHRLTPANTWVAYPPSHPKGMRCCRICKRRRNRIDGRLYWRRHRDDLNARRRTARRALREQAAA